MRAPDPILRLALIRAPDFVVPILPASPFTSSLRRPLLVPYYLTRIGGYSPLESGAVLALQLWHPDGLGDGGKTAVLSECSKPR